MIDTKRVHAHPVAGTLLLLCAAMFFFSCSDPLAPVPPVWEVGANVPIISRTLTIDELLNGQDAFTLSKDGANTIILHQIYPFTTGTLQDSLRLRDINANFSQNVGLLTYDIPDAVEKAVPLYATFPQLPNGVYAVPPTANSEKTVVQVDLRTRFQSLTFAQGTIRIDFTNNYAIPVFFPEPLAITDAGGNVLAMLTIPVTLQPGERYDCSPVSLAGVRLPGELQVQMPISSPGTNGVPVTIDRLSILRMHASIMETKLQEAISPIPAQEAKGTRTIDLAQQGFDIQEAELKQGMLVLRAASTLPVGSEVEATFDGIYRSGAPLRWSFTIEPGRPQTISLPLQDVILRPQAGHLIPASCTLRTSGSGENVVTISAAQGVDFSLALTGVSFRSFTGTLESREISFTRTSAFSLPLSDDHAGGIQFSAVKGTAMLNNGTAFPMQLMNGGITGSSSHSLQSVTVPLPAVALPGGTRTTIPLPDDAVTALFNGYSASGFDRLTATSRILLNPGGASGSIRESDSLSGAVYFDIPLRVNVTDATHSDTALVTMDMETRKRFERVTSGDLHFEFENGLPLDIHMLPDIWDDSYKTILPQEGGSSYPVDVPAATVDAKGALLSPTRSGTVLHLGAEDIARIAKATFIRVRMIFRTPGTAPVIFQSNNYLTVRVYAALDVSSKIAGN